MADSELITYINGLVPDDPNNIGPQGCNVYALLLINANPGFGPPNATKNDPMRVSVNDVYLDTWWQTNNLYDNWCPLFPPTIPNPTPPPAEIPNPLCSTYLGYEEEGARLMFLNQSAPLDFGEDTWPNSSRVMPKGAEFTAGEFNGYPSLRNYKTNIKKTWHSIPIDDYLVNPGNFIDFAYAGIITLDFIPQCYDNCAGPRNLKDKSGGWIGIVRYKKYNNKLYCDKYLPVYDANIYFSLNNAFPGVDNNEFTSQWFFYWWTEAFIRSSWDPLPDWVPIQDDLYHWPSI